MLFGKEGAWRDYKTCLRKSKIREVINYETSCDQKKKAKNKHSKYVYVTYLNLYG